MTPPSPLSATREGTERAGLLASQRVSGRIANPQFEQQQAAQQASQLAAQRQEAERARLRQDQQAALLRQQFLQDTAAQRAFQTGERQSTFENQQTQDVNRTGLQTGFRQNIIDRLPGILNRVGGDGGAGGPFPVGGPGGPGGPGGGGGGGTDAARAAAAGRAQERIGLATQGALRGLEGTLTSRGLSGPIEGAAIGNVLSQGLGQRGEFERDQAIAAAERQNQIDDRNFAANLAIRQQRSSNLGPILGLLQGGGANLF